MTLRIAAVDLKNPAISAAWLDLLDEYARDPMGGGTGLSPYAKANLVRELAELPTFHAALAWQDGEAVGLVHFTITAVAGRVVTTATCRICSSPSTFAVAASAAR